MRQQCGGSVGRMFSLAHKRFLGDVRDASFPHGILTRFPDDGLGRFVPHGFVADWF